MPIDHPIPEVRTHAGRGPQKPGNCRLGVTSEGLVRIMSANGHGFHVRLDELTAAVNAMNEEYGKQGRMFP